MDCVWEIVSLLTVVIHDPVPNPAIQGIAVNPPLRIDSVTD